MERRTDRARDLDEELQALTASSADVIEEFHVEWLNARLAEHDGMPVRRWRANFVGDRPRIVLADGVVVTIELAGPCRRRLVHLDGIARTAPHRWTLWGGGHDGSLSVVDCLHVSVSRSAS